MSPKIYEFVNGMGIFFGCGHRYIKAAERIPVLDTILRDHLICPICHHCECLVCGASFSGWLDSCEACWQFCTFDMVADNVVAKGIDKIHFQQGILVVPSVGNEPSKVFSWPETLTLGMGYVGFKEVFDADGNSYASEPMELRLSHVSSLDTRGQESYCGIQEMLIKVETVNTDSS
ncbi:hypothetical protein GGS26DRAFT_597319 [Hypomontagnella submonticulosa]|nr:hypothetical protein GGS26DRAFT_597319 [Hypomontagnella submonticulosa]